MTATELRIGNVVYLNGKRLTINGNDLSYLDNVEYLDAKYDVLSPVNIWQSEVDNCLTHKDVEIAYCGDDFVMDVMTLRYKRKVYWKIKYLHEFQNLHFFLTKQELTFKTK